MNTKEKLLELIDIYLERNKKLKKSYNDNITNKQLYEELFVIFNMDFADIVNNRLMISIILNTIYKNNIYSNFYDSILNVDIKNDNKKFTEFISRIKSDYYVLIKIIDNQEKRIKRSKNTVSSCNKVKLAIKQGLPIIQSNFDVNGIKKILNYFEIEGEISSKEEVLLINEIEQYNRMIASKTANDEERAKSNAIYNEVPNIVNAGFELYPEIPVSRERRENLEIFVNQILGFIDNLDDNQITDSIKNYRKYDISEDEYKYIVIRLINKYINDMVDYYELLINKEYYIDRKNRLEIINEYYKCLNKFLIIRDYYNELVEFAANEDEKIDETHDNKILIYSSSVGNGIKPRLLSDMRDVPYEYYDTVIDLLNRFKSSTLSKDEYSSLTNNRRYSGFRELRSDQIRIIIKHVKDEIYSVSGVFVKKSNNDLPMYDSLTNRPIPNISTKEQLDNQLLIAEYVEQELSKLVTEKGRKGNR